MAFVRYVDRGHVSFGYDCRGAGALLSAPIALDLRAEHTLQVFFGSMIPADRPRTQKESFSADWLRLRSSLLIRLDGETVLTGNVLTHPVPAAQILMGVNLPGSSSAARYMESSVFECSSVPLAAVAAYLRSVRVDTLRPEPDWRGYPGPVRMTVTVGHRPGPGCEPLLTAGASGSADCFCLQFKENEEPRLKFIHDGSEASGSALALETPPLLLGGDRRVDLVLSAGSLMPPADSPLYTAHPELKVLLDQVVLTLNGKVVLARRVEPSPTEAGQIRVVSNLIGIPGVESYFRGELGVLEGAAVASVIEAIPPFGADAESPAAPLDGYPGPLRLRVRFAKGPPGTADPLLATGVTGAGDIIFVRFEDPGHLRFGVDHWSYGAPTSGLIPFPDGADHDLVLSSGALFPPTGSPLYAAHPSWLKLRDWVVVGLDGKVVFAAPLRVFNSRCDEITPDYNGIGGSTTGMRFSGTVSSVRFTLPEVVLHWLSEAGH